ncbi:hypothetical protein RUM43_007481 [Polyplax serrata]|uniref:Kazal-like domain-containing protein n=1 Tax=Polyplax serrata TaxID=468196 RepID=A0AAN8SA69_POLSC
MENECEGTQLVSAGSRRCLIKFATRYTLASGFIYISTFSTSCGCEKSDACRESNQSVRKMERVYLLVATAAAVFASAANNDNDIIWYPVDEEDGVFISIFGEKYRTPINWYGGRSFGYTDNYHNFDGVNGQSSFFVNGSPRDRYKRDIFYEGFDPYFYQRIPNHEPKPFYKGPHFFRPGAVGWTDHLSHPIGKPSNSFNGPDNFIWSDRPFQPSQTEIHRPNRPIRPQGPTFPSRPAGNRPFDDGLVFPDRESDTPQRPTTTTPGVPIEPTTTSQCERTCPVTPEFNPVCGSDSTTYSNIGRLKCAQRCGKGVALAHYGNCRRARLAMPPFVRRNSIVFK